MVTDSVGWISEARGRAAIRDQEPGWERLFLCYGSEDHPPYGWDHYHLADPDTKILRGDGVRIYRNAVVTDSLGLKVKGKSYRGQT